MSRMSQKMMSAYALKSHMFLVHKLELKKVPNSKDGRESVEIDIMGMEGVPFEAIQERQRKEESGEKSPEGGDDDEKEDGPSTSSSTSTTSASAPTEAMPAPVAGMRAPVPGFAFRPPQPMGFPPPNSGMPFPYPGMPFAPPGPFPYGAPQPFGMPPMGAPPMGAPPMNMNAPMGGLMGAPPPMPGPSTVPPPSVAVPPPSTSGGSTEEKEDRGQVNFIFKEDEESMEEKRAKLRKYRVDDGVKAQLSTLTESIAQRLKELQNNLW